MPANICEKQYEKVQPMLESNAVPIRLERICGGGNQSKRGFDRAYGGEQTEQGRELWSFNQVNFARIAEDMGAIGIRVEKPGDIAPAIERACKAGRPVVIDVVTDIEVLAPLPVSE